MLATSDTCQSNPYAPDICITQTPTTTNTHAEKPTADERRFTQMKITTNGRELTRTVVPYSRSFAVDFFGCGSTAL
jgi:hypothetical protein